jgi:hypothetical protein
MNDKFENLLYNSGLTSQGCWDKLDEWDREAVLKFGELIVRNCIDILMKPEYAMTHPQELSKYNEGWVNGRLLGIEHIKEYFGVK